MEKFAVDLDKVLDEFEFNEGNILFTLCIFFILLIFPKQFNVYFYVEREQLQASISNGQSNIVLEAQVCT
jgi:hypothetical protein